MCAQACCSAFKQPLPLDQGMSLQRARRTTLRSSTAFLSASQVPTFLFPTSGMNS